MTCIPIHWAETLIAVKALRERLETQRVAMPSLWTRSWFRWLIFAAALIFVIPLVWGLFQDLGEESEESLTVLEALIYGLIQGLTEFLPVSSSGHLALAHMWGLGHLPAELELPFDVLLHAATFLAIVIALWRDLLALCRWCPRHWLLILVGALPAGLFGLFGGDVITALRHHLWVIAICYVVTAIMLVVAERLAVAHERSNRSLVKNFDHMTFKQAGIVGLFQMPAPLAGISRSGSTLAGGLVARLETDFAVRYAFLVGLPLIGGAAAKDALDGGFSALHAAVGFLPLAVAFITSLVSGVAAIAMLRFLAKKRRLSWFAAYCVALALVCFVVMAMS